MFRKNLVIKHLALLAALAVPALATPIKLTMTGNVLFTNMTAFGVGQSTTVSIVYESSASYQSLMTQQAFYVNAMTSLSVTSGAYSGTDNTDPFGVINKYNDLQPWFATQPWDGITFAAFHNAGNYTFTSGANTVDLPSVFSNGITQTFEGVRVNLEADHPTVWNDWSLPLTLSFSEFNVNHSMLVYFSDGSFQIDMTSLRAEVLAPTGPTAVPDAGSTALLALIGLGALAWAHRATPCLRAIRIKG